MEDVVLNNQKLREVDGVKITHLVYRILDFLPENDPLKNRAKEKALAILENATLLLTKKEKARIEILVADIEVLEQYLGVGKYQGWISAINFLIITKEYERIKNNLAIGLKTQEDPKKIRQVASSGNHQLIVVDKPLEHEQLSNKALTRHAKILDILARRQKAQVSDLIKELPSITKRTVRRDLDDLLKRGRVVRAGAWNQVFYQIHPVK